MPKSGLKKTGRKKERKKERKKAGKKERKKIKKERLLRKDADIFFFFPLDLKELKNNKQPSQILRDCFLYPTTADSTWEGVGKNIETKIVTFIERVQGCFHKSWVHDANHRESSIKVVGTVQIALYASKKLLKSWA